MVSWAAGTWPRARVLNWLLFILGVITLGLCFRYLLIEPHDIGLACAADGAPWWCQFRLGVILMHAWTIWGYVALGAGVLAVVTGSAWIIRIGLAFSLMALMLYNADYGAAGFVLSLIRLPRA